MKNGFKDDIIIYIFVYKILALQIHITHLRTEILKGRVTMELNKIIHSTSKYSFANKDRQISCAILKDDCDAVSLRLRISKSPNFANIPMEVYETVALSGQVYTVYTAVIPASMIGEEGSLEYSIEANGEIAFTETLEVVSLKNVPALIITEIYCRPRGLMATQFVELTNISSEPVDLYDYKLMMHSGYERSGNEPIKENYFSDNVGELVLGPGESAAVRFLTPAAHKAGDGQYTDAEGFCSIINGEYGCGKLGLSAQNVKIFSPEISVKASDGSWKLKLNAFELPSKQAPYTILIVPRDGGFDDARFSVKLNRDGDRFDWDFRVKHSSLWGIDLASPLNSNAVRIAKRAVPTPGYLDVGQAVPDLNDIFAPLIIADEKNTYAYINDGDLCLSFCVVDKFPINASLTYIDESSELVEVKAEATDEKYVYCVKIPQKAISKLRRFDYFITAKDSLVTVTSGSTEEPHTLHLYDNMGPELLKLSPSDRSVTESEDNDGKVTIRGKYFDVSGVNTSKCILCIDKKNVSSKVEWNADGFQYTAKGLKDGKHTIELALFDTLGNKTYHISHFEKRSNSELFCYRGEIHCHTTGSDGSGYPEDAYTYARDTGKVDFFAVTDHSHYYSDKEYANFIDLADRFDDPGKFAALYGFEMTWNMDNGWWGHMNVLNTDWILHDINNIPLPKLFEHIVSDPDAVAMFNHPGYHWGNFDEFSYFSPDICKKVCLSEIKGAGYDREYANLLAKGWHASPTFSEDNHSPNWTTETLSTTCVLSPALTRENILDSMRKRRTYSTGDPTLKLSYKINGQWLGSTLYDPTELNAEISVSTDSEFGIGNISIVAEDNITVASINVGARQRYTWKVTLLPEFDYYYVKIVSNSGYTVTAPVWIERAEPIKISKLNVGLSLYVDKPNAVVAEIENPAETAVESLRVDFYLSDADGFELSKTVPYYTLYIDKLEAGERKVLRAVAPNIGGYRRLSLVVRGYVKDKLKKISYADTAFVMLTPVFISAVLPLSRELVYSRDPDGEALSVANPFPYITLWNTTHSEISLDGHSLRLWTKTGKSPSDGHIRELNGMVIKPRSSFVIWVRHGNTFLDVGDFNARYGTSFVEGEGFCTVDTKVVSAGREGHRIDIICGKDIISRVHYNYGINVIDGDVKEDCEIRYRYIPNMTSTSEILSVDDGVLPGTVADDQRPEYVYRSMATEKPKLQRKLAQKHKNISTASYDRRNGKTSAKSAAFVTLGAAAVGAAVGAGALLLTRKRSVPESRNTSEGSSPATLVAPTALAIASLLPGKTDTKTKVKVKENRRSVKSVTTTVTTTKAKKSDIAKKVEAKPAERKTPCRTGSKSTAKAKDNSLKAQQKAVKQVKKDIKKIAKQNKSGTLGETPTTPQTPELR